jgi:2-methylcitrate dehydratase PrpD
VQSGAGATPASAAEALGGFVAGSQASDLPAHVLHEAKRSLLNFFATTIGAADDPAVVTAVKVLLAASGPPVASLIGRSECMDGFSAAFVNAIGANLLDYDDTHPETIIHPTAPVAPAVLAVAEQRGSSGLEVLHAVALGGEVECRLGRAVSPGHYARGWHITATCGVFGAAGAAARLLGLDAAQTAHALGIAASQAGGIVENLPTGAKNVGVGNAARNGLFAATMAAHGYTAAPMAIEGPRGWMRASGDAPDVATVLEGLGSCWEIARNTFKPYPCGIVLHSVIDACLALRAELALAAEQIASVVVSGHSLLLERADRPVANARDARVSIHHSVAVSLLYGAAGVREFSDEIVADARVAALREKVRAEVDATMPVGAARVVVRTSADLERSTTVVNPRGSIGQPMTDGEIADKLRGLVAGRLPSSKTERLITAVWALDEARDVHELMALARP